MKIKYFLIFLAFIFTQLKSFAQISPTAEQRAREELSKRGLNDEDVKKRLSAKGIDLTNINPNDAAAMFKAQKALEDVLKEIESENVKSKPTSNVANNSKIDTLKKDDKKIIAKKADEVSKSVKDGASLEEAVSETLADGNENNNKPVTLYGQELFRNQSLKLYRQSKDVKAPDNYKLGVGDILSITIWGDSEESSIYEISEDGYIKPSGMARIYLKGIQFGEAKNLLRKKFQNYYKFKDNQFELSLNYARTINVSIVGEVYNFGNFNIPAINTAFNALVAAGGPNEIGSVRNIKLIRAGQASKNIDVYKYLVDPSIGSDLYLEENDIIHIPAAGKTISIEGSVKKPFTYELLPNENFADLIKYARGFTPNAYKKNIQVVRFENDNKVIIDLNWGEYEISNKDFVLKAGDVVEVNEIPSQADNYITLNGAVKNPGKFAFIKNDKITDLLNKAEIENAALLELSFIKRLNDDGITISYIPINIAEAKSNPNSAANVMLKAKDIVTIISKSNLVDNSYFSVTGAVRRPDTFAYDFKKTIKVSDALLLSNGKRDNASDIAFISRVDKTNPKQLKYIKINIKEIATNPNSKDNIYLEPKDALNIFTKEDLVDDLFVTIGGEVRAPSKIVYDPTLTIQDVIQMAKGINLDASLSNIEVYRMDFDKNKSSKIKLAKVELDENQNVIGDNFTLKPFDEIFVRKAPEFELPRKVSLRGEVRFPGEYVLLKDNETFSSLVSRAGGLTKEASVEAVQFYRQFDGKGYLTSDFKKAMQKPGSYNDIILLENDDIVIPKSENLVVIYGSTRAAKSALGGEAAKRINVPFEGKKNAKHYIETYAGGVDEEGDLNNVSVKDLSGKVKGVKKILFFKIYPKVEIGSIVYVPQKPKVDPEKKSKVDWSNVLQNSVSQATAILTFILLINRI